jgi:hypothetical protein
VATNFSNRRSRRLGFQPLEDRTLMAGDVGAVLSGGTLTLTGDANANDVQVIQNIDQNGALIPGDFSVVGYSTTINGHSSAHFTGVGNLNASLGSGDDTFRIGPFASPTPLANNATLPGYLFINLGDGHNELHLNGTTVGGQAIISSGDSFDQLFVRGTFYHDLQINSGGSADFIQVNDSFVGNDLWIQAGFGKDNDIINVDDTTVVHNAIVYTGDSPNGDFVDTVQIDNLKVYHDLELFGGQGEHAFSIKNSFINDELFMRLGSGEDGVAIANTTIGNKMDIDMGAGNDTLQISDSRAGSTVKIQLGDGNDTLSMSKTTGGAATLDGGAGIYDKVYETDVHFGSELRFNFEPMFFPFSLR